MRLPLKATFLALLICASSFAFAGESAASRADSAATVLNEIMAAPDKGIPEEVLGSAKCIAVVPSLLKGGFVFGGSHGRGMATCRTENGWSAPAPLHMTGGSFGFQIGVQGVDLVMMVMNDRGMQALLSNKFKLGADASAAAGPVGRHAEGSTDWKLHAEVLTYSRARGLFAGVTVNGSSITQDDDATRELYGRMIPFRTILTGSVDSPPGGQVFVAAVGKATGHEGKYASTPSKPPAAPAPASAPSASADSQPAVQPVSAPASTPAADAAQATPPASAPATDKPSPSTPAPSPTPPPR